MKSLLATFARAFAQLVATNLKRFLLGALIGGGVFALLVGGLGYFLVREEPFWRLATVGVLTAIGTMIVAVVIGARMTASQALRDWVDASGVGPLLSKVIFKQALGVSDKKPQGSKQLASELDGATLGDAKSKLTEHLGELFLGDSLDRWLPAQGRWVAKKLTSSAGWAVMRTLLQHIPGADQDDARVDLLALRDGLSDGLADKAVSLMTGRATIMTTIVVGVVAAVCIVTAGVLGMA